MDNNEKMTWLWFAFYAGALGRTATNNLQGLGLLFGAIGVIVLSLWMKRELELR